MITKAMTAIFSLKSVEFQLTKNYYGTILQLT